MLRSSFAALLVFSLFRPSSSWAGEGGGAFLAKQPQTSKPPTSAPLCYHHVASSLCEKAQSGLAYRQGREDRWQKIAGILNKLDEGSIRHDDALSRIFGTSRPYPSWTWQAYYDSMLARRLRNSSRAGVWNQPLRLKAEDRANSSVFQSFWPVILEDAAKQIVKAGGMEVLSSDASLAKFFPGDRPFKHTCQDIDDDGTISANRDYFTLQTWLASRDRQCLWKVDNLDVTNLTSVFPDYVRVFGLIGVGRVGSGLNWAGCDGVRHMPFHTDGSSWVAACQFAGEKNWHLLPPEATGEITSMSLLQMDRGDGMSRVRFYNPFGVNNTCFARKHTITPLVVRVREGECMMMPPNFWHSTESHGARAISVNFNADVNMPTPTLEILNEVQGWQELGNMFSDTASDTAEL